MSEDQQEWEEYRRELEELKQSQMSYAVTAGIAVLLYDTDSFKRLGFDVRHSSPFYTITLGPGVIRYIRFEDFLAASVEDVVMQLQELAETPQVMNPRGGFGETSGPRLEFDGVEILVAGGSWDDRLRIHHALGNLLLNEKMPSSTYAAFHEHLELGKHFAFAECLDAWVKTTGTSEGRDLSESYRDSSEHLLVQNCRHELVVFRKTDFIQVRLITISEEQEERSAAAETAAQRQREDAAQQRAKAAIEVLAKSNFDTYVYLMEDLRNGTFKIGRSKTPEKRERTLQSEVPETKLRFAIPGKEEHEKQLHRQLQHKNQRGEWFALTVDEVLWVISFLKESGDPARASVDHEWFAGLFFKTKVGIALEK